MRSYFRAMPLALAVALIALLSGTASAQAQKNAYIRSSVLLDQAPGRVEAQQQFEKETAPFSDQIKRMRDSLDTMVASYTKAQGTLTPAARDARGRDIQGKQAEYQRRTNDLQQKAQQREAELVQPILDRVKGAIEEVRVEGGYSFVFNADQGSSLVAMDKNLDITDRVLTKLRSTTAAAPKPATGAPATAPSGVTRPQTPPLD
jgi:outer membrane protein